MKSGKTVGVLRAFTSLDNANTPGGLVALLVLGLMAAGCGKSESPGPAASPAAPASAPVAMPALQAGATPPPPPGQGNAPAPGGAAATPSTPSAPTAIDFTASNRPVNDSGQPLSDLEWLNQLLEAHRMRGSSSDPAGELGGRIFKNQDEEMAAIAAIRAKNRVVVRDLSDLVKAGVIKSIPAAPPGQKYVLDSKSGQVILAAQ